VRPSTRAPLPQLLWGAAYVVVGTAIAAVIAWPVYQSPRVALIAAASLVLAAAVVALGSRLRLPWWLLVVVAFFVYLLAVVPLAVPSSLGSLSQIIEGLRAGIVGITLGWKQLLTLDLPLGEYQAVLVPLFLTFFSMCVLALAVIVRAGRSAPVAVPAVAVMAAFGIVFGSSDTSDSAHLGPLVVPAAREVALGVALVVLSLIWLTGRSRLQRARALSIARASTGTVRQRSESLAIALRRNTLAVVLVVVALAAGVAITPAAATLDSRQALRDAVDPLLVVQQQPSPLSTYRSWFAGASFEQPIFTVSGAPESVDRIRIATLDSYDGETFHLAGVNDDDVDRFTRLPRTEPTTGNPPQFEITIGEGYSGIWVPVPSGLAAAPQFSGARDSDLANAFYISDSSSTAIDVAPGADGRGLQPGDQYTVYASPTEVSLDSLGSESPGVSLLGDSSYPALEEWVKLQNAPRNAAGLAQLVEALSSRGYLSHSVSESGASDNWIAALEGRADFVFQPSYSGHSGARIEALFTSLLVQQKTAGEDAEAEALVAGVGDDEQFATAAALIARYLGFDSRVVLGTRLHSDDPELAVAPCDATCTGANVAAWIEVRAPGTGAWVTMDSSPQFIDPPATISTGIELPKNPTVPDDVQSDVVEPPETDRGNSDVLTPQQEEGTSWLTEWLPVIRLSGLISLAALLLVLPALVLVFAKLSRRRLRRGMKVPEVSVVGAWDELVDSYADFGLAVPRALSRAEFARATGRPAARELAALVDRAVFAEHPPGRDASASSWELLDAERAELAHASSFSRRLRALVSPASFVRHFEHDTRLGAALTLFRRKESIR
jgi:hypothetical protein